jgi:hypothetical protein
MNCVGSRPSTSGRLILLRSSQISPLAQKYILLFVIVALFVPVFLHGISGFYDHDEFSHYVSLKGMDKHMWFSPWQRVGFKVLYYPLSALDLDVLRFVNMLWIGLAVFLLWKLADIFVAGIFMTFPFVQQLGARFYAEIPAVALIVLAIYLLKRERYTLFALTLSYAVLVRFEIALMFVPAVYILRKRPMDIVLLFAFPLLYYVAATAATTNPLYLLRRYLGYGSDLKWKGDLLHYLRAVVTMGGLWGLLAFGGIINGLRAKEEYKRFMALSAVLITLLLTLSYWEKTGFGPITGHERYILLIAPMVAFFAREAVDRFKVPLLAVGLAIALSVPYLKPDLEMRSMETACIELNRLKYSRLFVDHQFVNYRLGKPLNGPDTATLKHLGDAQPGDLLLWDSHYAIKQLRLDTVSDGWSTVWQVRQGNLQIVIFRKL